MEKSKVILPWTDDDEPTRETIEFQATYRRRRWNARRLALVALNVAAWAVLAVSWIGAAW